MHISFLTLLLLIPLTAIAMTLSPLGLVYLSGEGDFIVDSVWMLDVALNFRTAFSKHGRLVFSPRLVANEYVKPWFALDLVTAWPVVMTQDALRLTQRVVGLSSWRASSG